MSKNRRKNNGVNEAVTGKRYSLDESIYNSITAVLNGFKGSHVPLDIITKAVDNVYEQYHKPESRKPNVDMEKLNKALDKIDEMFHGYTMIELDLEKLTDEPADLELIGYMAKRIVLAYLKDIDGLDLHEVTISVKRQKDGAITLGVNIPRE